jgi:hypothetical protein
MVHGASRNNNANFNGNWQIKTTSPLMVGRIWVLPEELIIQKLSFKHKKKLCSYL